MKNNEFKGDKTEKDVAKKKKEMEKMLEAAAKRRKEIEKKEIALLKKENDAESRSLPAESSGNDVVTKKPSGRTCRRVSCSTVTTKWRRRCEWYTSR